MKKSIKKNIFRRSDFTPFMRIFFFFIIWEHFFTLLFPKDSEDINSLDIELQEVGEKQLKGVRKCDGQTDK